MKRGAEVVTNVKIRTALKMTHQILMDVRHSVLCFSNTDATYQLVLHSGWSNFISSSKI